MFVPAKLRTVQATRYVLPLREGGSLPAIVEADDSGLYVVKFRGAGQGPLALVAELVAGEIGRALGIAVPELVLAEVDPVLARNEPDQEIRDLVMASGGLNLAMDYLPGSLMFDPAAKGLVVDPIVASQAVWFDAFVTNVDRTARNANLLWWHKRLQFIDHGAALYFHHNWAGIETAATSPFTPIKDHVLLRYASAIGQVDAALRSRLSKAVFAEILAMVPEAWFFGDAHSKGYVEYFVRRLAAADTFMQEAIRARARLF